jgi:hypothetical protein
MYLDSFAAARRCAWLQPDDYGCRHQISGDMLRSPRAGVALGVASGDRVPPTRLAGAIVAESVEISDDRQRNPQRAPLAGREFAQRRR